MELDTTARSLHASTEKRSHWGLAACGTVRGQETTATGSRRVGWYLGAATERSARASHAARQGTNTARARNAAEGTATPFLQTSTPQAPDDGWLDATCTSRAVEVTTISRREVKTNMRETCSEGHRLGQPEPRSTTSHGEKEGDSGVKLFA